MPDTHLCRTVGEQVNGLIKNLQIMLQTLQEEHQALNTADAIALEDIAARKAQAVETISGQYENFRHNVGLEDELSQDNRAPSLTDTLQQIRASTPELAGQFDQLLALTRACRQSNLENGTLVNVGMHNCQANLGLLQRLSQPVQTGTYGPGAQPENSFDSLHRLQLRA